MNTQLCTICKIEKEFEKYSKDRSRKGGYDKTCKECKKKQDIARQELEKINVVLKKCHNCKNEYTSTNFHKNKSAKDGLHTECKHCKRKRKITKKEENLKKILPDDYVKKCTACNINKNKDEFYKNIYTKDGIGTYCIVCEKLRTKEWRENNQIKVAGYRRTQYPNYQNRRKNDSQFKLSGNMRNRIRMALKRQTSSKFNNSYELIGCSPAFLKNWIEYQFDSNMSWENYGKYWSIDHVLPCNFYNLKEKTDQLECFNWRNCRPLNILENGSKNDKIQTFQILLQEIKVHYYEQHSQIAGIS